ncbi:MAG: DUF3316 domain-containing protein [Paludibacteraceae bacterium]|nr:DUF3316 domain-containing protein [Paludibacteraceae bacterium]
MKRYVILFIMCLTVGVAVAQCLNRWNFGAGQLTHTDQVLSDQEYKGVSVSFEGLHVGNYRKKENNIFWSFIDRLDYSWMHNSSQTARMHYVSVKLDFGTHYAFDLGRGFKLSAGGLVDVSGAVGYVPRNVNNIASADVQFGLRAVATVHYRYRVNDRFSFACHYGLTTPVVGCFFSPEYGESYYEIWKHLSSSLARDLHFSSFHNRHGVSGIFDFDFIFRTGVLTVGLRHNNEWWHATGNSFSISDIRGTIGFALRLASITPY